MLIAKPPPLAAFKFNLLLLVNTPFFIVYACGLFFQSASFASASVTGVVKDPTGEPVIGANVIIKGTTNGTVTDIDGKFLLSASKGDIISVSFIGYKMQELPVASDMNIILAEDSQMLENVVVIGYGTVKKNDATGSVIATSTVL